MGVVFPFSFREEEFLKYKEDTLHPFEVLLDSGQRPLLHSLLSSYNGAIQLDFFGKHEEETLDYFFEWCINVKDAGGHLYSRWLDVINGKERMVCKEKPELRRFASKYLLKIIGESPLHDRAHGGEREYKDRHWGWTAKQSLESHLPIGTAFSFDLSEAVMNITDLMVFSFFYDKLEGYEEFDRQQIAGFFTELCTVEYGSRRGLPQGSSLQMSLFNRVLYPLDVVLSERAEFRDMTYSRWVDDFTISFPEQLPVEEFLGALALVRNTFPIAQHKVFFQEREPIYLLGNRIENGAVIKNSREERETKKVKPLDLSPWFGGVL
ncbi:hypothetical protein HYT57_01540 [Candidatus Woesearchaeota archaeon]|nr:hypothetical protein [Candidatus Woesearchaeota archaeon]